MKYFIDITLLPDTEINLGFIWQKVYQQVHLALVDNKTVDAHSAIAVSFPEYGNKTYPLGSKLRLIALNKELLQQLDIGRWLSRLSDYSHCTSIKEVPTQVTTFVRFSRRQFDSNIDRLTRRRAKRKNETVEQALLHYEGWNGEESQLPFLNVESLSSGKTQRTMQKHKFRLFIQRSFSEKSISGTFGCYGLSKTATLPWF